MLAEWLCWVRVIEVVGVQNEPPQDVFQGHADYFELKANWTPQVQERLLLLLSYLEEFESGGWDVIRITTRNDFLHSYMAGQTNNS